MLSYQYKAEYESSLIRGLEEPRPWDLLEEISIYLNKQNTLLDIGCGTAFKTLSLADAVHSFIGLEPNLVMQDKALENAKKLGVNNFHLVTGYSQQLPFNDNSFDKIITIMAPHYFNEIHRVLKPNGWAIIETLGERDHYNLKLAFGKDEQGWRGQLLNLEKNAVYQKNMDACSKLFSEVKMLNGVWKTYYTVEELILLLQQTPLVRDFNSKKDQEIIDSICHLTMTDKGIETTQHRILISVRKY